MSGRPVRLAGRGGDLVVLIPEDVEDVKELSLDDVYGDSGPKHADFALILRRGDREYLVVIEETEGPRVEDFDKIDNTVRDLRNMVGRNAFVIRIIHHRGGVSVMLLNLARNRRCELQRCGNVLDLVGLMRKRGLV